MLRVNVRRIGSGTPRRYRVVRTLVVVIVRPRSLRQRAAVLCLIVGAVVWASVSIRGGVTATRRQRRPTGQPPMSAAPRRSTAVVERRDGVASNDVTDGSDDVLHATDGEIAEATAEPTADEPVVTARVYEPAAPELADEPAAAAEHDTGTTTADPALDLTRIEHDLAGVEAALRRLDDGTYWTDEVTGDPLDEALLLADPVARRNR